MKDILEFCGYNSAYSMLSDHMTIEERIMFFEDLVNSPEDAVDFVREEVERIAADYFDWVDHERMKSDADEEAYQRYRDGD
jgi:hypothetical protein